MRIVIIKIQVLVCAATYGEGQ